MTRLSGRLPGLTDAQILWGVEHIVPHEIYTTGKRCWCTACGHAFTAKDIGETMECPHCHRKCKVERNQKRICHGFEYFQLITTCKGWQVIRYFVYRWDSRCGGELKIYSLPVMEKWCRPGQPTVTLAAPVKMMSYYQQQPYSEWSPISVKNQSFWSREWMRVCIYPRKSILPTYLKCGYTDAMLETYCAETIFCKIFAIPHFEALYKAGRLGELKEKMEYAEQFSKYWPSIRVALRHGFDPFKQAQIKYITNYWDYLAMLKFLRKDMRSPHYVAPKDWDGMHRQINSEAQRRRAKMMEARERAEAIRRAQAEEERLRQEKAGKRSFARRIKKFAGLLIVGDGLNIAPLMTIKEFAEEGAAMHHCVFSNAYYKKPNSLILSAKDDNGKRVETIEVDLNGWCVLQSHGVSNCYTDRHDDIINLVTANMDAIRAASGRKRAPRA